MARDIALDIPPVLLDQLDKMVQEGLYKTRAEAVREGVRLLIRRREVRELKEKIKCIKTDTKDVPSLTGVVLEQHQEDDIL